MKYKKELGGFLVLLGLAWQVFSFISSDYTPTQVILAAIFCVSWNAFNLLRLF